MINHEQQPYLSLRDSVSNIFKSKTSKEDFWALKDVSFDVMPGDTVGIIGKNGAGKSTLLKILSKITPPTTGKIVGRGRIASLLEVGTGFHPELTGRENIFMNGSILGMRRAEILRNFNAIVDFAGVEKFIDTPLKHYSSGMQLRLAFAVAAFLENEILIIDEVLAVGDAEFQKKCMGKMQDVSESGRTILFVSHDLTAISNLTKKTAYLKNGNLVGLMETEAAIETYLEDGAKKEKHYFKNSKPGFEKPLIVKAELKTSLPNNVQEHGKLFSLEIECRADKIPDLPTWLSVHITDNKGKGILHLTTGGTAFPICDQPGITKLTCEFPALKMYMGHYYVNLYLSGPPHSEVYERLAEVISFEVVMNGSNHEFGWLPDACTYIETINWSKEHV